MEATVWTSRKLVEVSLVREALTASYRVRPNDAALGDVLVSMGFSRANGYFARSFPDSADVPRLFANFTSHIDELIRYKRRERPAPWDRALELVDERLSGRVDWWLDGSAALAVRGIDDEPRDLDLVVDDAERAGRLMEDILIEPVREMEGWVADWHGRAFEGALIEWVSGVHAGVEPIRRSRDEVLWRGRGILCSPLDLQLAVARERGLTRHAAAISSFIGERSDRG